MNNFFKKIGAVLFGRGPIGWVRRFFSVVKTYHANMRIVAEHVDRVDSEVKEVLRYVKRATKVHVDVGVGYKDITQVVIIGQYRGRDYVNTFNLKPGSIEDLIKRLTWMSRYANIGCIDAPVSVDATIKHSLKDRGVM